MRNLWFKVVCYSYTSLAVHSNVITELKIIHELQKVVNYSIYKF